MTLKNFPPLSNAQNHLIQAENGNSFLRIPNLEKMPPFFICLTGDSDVWAFISSTGALSAGRGHSENAFFPYCTVDKIHDSYGITGPATLIRLSSGELWEPFDPKALLSPDDCRYLDKSILGNELRFREDRQAAGLSFSYKWCSSHCFGLVREASLKNTGPHAVSLSIIDGVSHLLPPGVGSLMQARFSCLAQSYNRHECMEGTRLNLYVKTAGIVDLPVPVECLHAHTVWSTGLPGATVFLSEAVLKHFREGRMLHPQNELRGERGAYFLNSDMVLAPGEEITWRIVINGPLDGGEVSNLYHDLLADEAAVAEHLSRSLDESRRYLSQLLSGSDAFQKTRSNILDAHHCANVTYNIMRGGVPVDDDRINCDHFSKWVSLCNQGAARRHRAVLEELPGWLPLEALKQKLDLANDPVMDRLVTEYLPLTFSRRHGDPSRPWNLFSIRVRNKDGSPIAEYEGNWRDIFQNWEALALSYPFFLKGIITRFINASTMDGYNPYRITGWGVDWEVPDAKDAWAGIGYWGDHQIPYLNKLLEQQESVDPGSLARWLPAARHVYTDIPYLIRPCEEMLRHPRETIVFDEEKNRKIRDERSRFGNDAVLRRDETNQPVCVSFFEKLLVPVLVKLTNFVPGGGIWMNTQRPEWNDANNALVGYGLSMVSVCQLRRHLALLQRIFKQTPENKIEVSAPVVELFEALNTVLCSPDTDILTATDSPAERAQTALHLFRAGSVYRDAVYRKSQFQKYGLSPRNTADFLCRALDWLDSSIRFNRREDGLYNSYNVLDYDISLSRFDVLHLFPMLEGVVAVLSTGTLSAGETLDLLDALRRSKLYREDLDSYLLYPDRRLPRFLEKGVIPPERIKQMSLLNKMLHCGDTRLVVRDGQGSVRFHPNLTTLDAVEIVLASLREDPSFSSAWPPEQEEQVLSLYREVFKHKEYTGRSGTMFGYEGLGCTYWHMVSKLLLAVQECCFLHDSNPLFSRLADSYYRIRQGLGFNKTPQEYGAFPTDPYSHTPSEGGAKQPGMTGQVKEEVITRFGELGVRTRNGEIVFNPVLLKPDEFLEQPDRFRFYDRSGTETTLFLEPDELAFTLCRTPIIYRLGSGMRSIEITLQDGRIERIASDTLGPEWSRAIWRRDERIKTVRVFLTPSDLLQD